MSDERTPIDLRSRVGAYITTKYLDDELGVYLYENRHSGTHHLFLREGTRWEWAMRAQSSGELAGLVMIMRRMGIDVHTTQETVDTSGKS